MNTCPPTAAASIGRCERGPHPLNPQRHRKQQFHRLFSAKAGLRVVLCAGQLEADAIIVAEGDPDVTALCEQPLRVHGPIGTNAYVTLDLGLTYRSGEERFFDIHHDSDLRATDDGRRLPEHWQRIEALCAESGHRCEVLTDEMIETHRTRIGNWRHLLPLVRTAYERPNPKVVDDILELLDTHGDMTLDELGCRIRPADADDVFPSAAVLLHDGRCTAELDTKAFSRGRPIRLTADA